MQWAPCTRAKKRGGGKGRPTIPKAVVLPNLKPVEPVEEEGVSPAKSVVIIRPSVTSVTSAKFDGGRMIQARMDFFERRGLEENYLIADGEERGSFCFL